MFCIFPRNGFHMRASKKDRTDRRSAASQRLPMISLRSFDEDQLFTFMSVVVDFGAISSHLAHFSSFCLEATSQERLAVCYD